MFEEPLELADFSGPADLWQKALAKEDAVTAAHIMKEHTHEIASALLADPEIWSDWEDIAKRALVPTAAPSARLFDIVHTLLNIEIELYDFGNADPAAMAVRKLVKKLVKQAIPVFGEAYKATHRRLDSLGPEIAKAAFSGFTIQPELLD